MPNRKKPKVYITRRLPDAVETRMRELFDAELNITDEARTQPELVEAMRSADVLVPTVTDKIDAALIEQIGARIGPFDLVADRVPEDGLGHVEAAGIGVLHPRPEGQNSRVFNLGRV